MAILQGGQSLLMIYNVDIKDINSEFRMKSLILYLILVGNKQVGF